MWIYLKSEGGWLEKEGGFPLIDGIEDAASMGILNGFAWKGKVIDEIVWNLSCRSQDIEIRVVAL